MADARPPVRGHGGPDARKSDGTFAKRVDLSSLQCKIAGETENRNDVPAAHLKWRTQIKKGVLELCCLNLLASEQLYGYELAKRLSEARSFDVSLGTVYPLLSRLSKEGLVTSTLEESPSGPARRKYHLSAEGRRRLAVMNREWRAIAGMIESYLPDAEPGA